MNVNIIALIATIMLSVAVGLASNWLASSVVFLGLLFVWFAILTVIDIINNNLGKLFVALRKEINKV